MSVAVGFIIGSIALPALIFSSIARLDVSSIEPKLICAVLISKLVIGSLGGAAGALAKRGSHVPGAQLVSAGAVALFCTQSDDLGLGLPFFEGVRVLLLRPPALV